MLKILKFTIGFIIFILFMSAFGDQSAIGFSWKGVMFSFSIIGAFSSVYFFIKLFSEEFDNKEPTHEELDESIKTIERKPAKMGQYWFEILNECRGQISTAHLNGLLVSGELPSLIEDQFEKGVYPTRVASHLIQLYGGEQNIDPWLPQEPMSEETKEALDKISEILSGVNTEENPVRKTLAEWEIDNR